MALLPAALSERLLASPETGRNGASSNKCNNVFNHCPINDQIFKIGIALITISPHIYYNRKKGRFS